MFASRMNWDEKRCLTLLDF